jgi:hypothetical protein
MLCTGGCFSGVALVLCVAVALILTLPFRFDNVLETRTLVPNLSIDPALKNNFNTNLTLSLLLQSYGDRCQALPDQPLCDPAISFQWIGLTSQTATPTSASPSASPFKTSCTSNLATKLCNVTLSCLNCLISDTASLRADFSQSLSMADAIDWQVNFTSGTSDVTITYSDWSRH